MSRFLSALCLGWSVVFIGCLHHKEVRGMIQESGTYASIQSLLAALEPMQLQKWESLVTATPRPRDVPLEFEQFRSTYVRGFQQGYAYYAAGLGKVHTSCRAERNTEEHAFVQGWCTGQTEAEIDQIDTALERVERRDVGVGPENSKSRAR